MNHSIHRLLRRYGPPLLRGEPCNTVIYKRAPLKPVCRHDFVSNRRYCAHKQALRLTCTSTPISRLIFEKVTTNAFIRIHPTSMETTNRFTSYIYIQVFRVIVLNLSASSSSTIHLGQSSSGRRVALSQNISNRLESGPRDEFCKQKSAVVSAAYATSVRDTYEASYGRCSKTLRLQTGAYCIST